MPDQEKITRIILLNSLQSKSVSRAPREFSPPIHGCHDLLRLIENRKNKNLGIEYIESEDADDENVRKANGSGKSLIWLKDIDFVPFPDGAYVALLFERLNHLSKRFAVADLETRVGKHLTGQSTEVGATTCHVLVKLPSENERDEAFYRCAIEYTTAISRASIAHFLCRQLRRETKEEAYVFAVRRIGKGGKLAEQMFKYRPRLELLAHLGRGYSLNTGTQITHMVFTKRKEKQNTAGQTHVVLKDFVADVEIKVAASDGPENVEEKQTWLSSIRQMYAERGYKGKIYFKTPKGTTAGGKINEDVSVAADLIMSPKEIIEISGDPEPWRASIDHDIVTKMRALLDRNDLWE